MMENNKWYILQVQTGLELDVQKELLRRGVEAIVPLENRQIHRAKQWMGLSYRHCKKAVWTKGTDT